MNILFDLACLECDLESDDQLLPLDGPTLPLLPVRPPDLGEALRHPGWPLGSPMLHTSLSKPKTRRHIYGEASLEAKGVTIFLRHTNPGIRKHAISKARFLMGDTPFIGKPRKSQELPVPQVACTHFEPEPLRVIPPFETIEVDEDLDELLGVRFQIDPEHEEPEIVVFTSEAIRRRVADEEAQIAGLLDQFRSPFSWDAGHQQDLRRRIEYHRDELRAWWQ